jgi:hypothetical protein
MFKLIEAETIPLTRELVEKHMKMEPSPTERELDPARLKYLREKAEAGQLVTFSWARAKLGGKIVRMNGQHSSTMLSELNGSFPDGLHVHLDTYQVDGPTDLAELFRQFDARKSSRTASDVAGAYQGLHTNLANVSRPVAKLAVEGIAYYQINVTGTRTAAGDDQYTLFEDLRWHPFIKWMGDLFSVKTPEMKSIPIAAAMFATYHVNEGEARIFWDQVARGGVEFDDNAPATILDSWLKAAKDSDFKRRFNLKPANFYQGCIFAWNAFREQKPLKEIRFRVDKGILDPVS